MTHPAPYVPARPVASVAEMPGAARSLRTAAEASGWAVEGLYAVGWAPATGKPGTEALTSSCVLRGRRGAERFVAGWSAPWRGPDDAILRRRDVLDIDPEPNVVKPWRPFVAERVRWDPFEPPDPFARPGEHLPVRATPPARWTYELGTTWRHGDPPLGTLYPGIGWRHPDGTPSGWLSAADLKTRIKTERNHAQ